MVDLQLIWDLHKSEVFKVGRALGVPESILIAPPSADLWEGQVSWEGTWSLRSLAVAHDVVVGLSVHLPMDGWSVEVTANDLPVSYLAARRRTKTRWVSRMTSLSCSPVPTYP